MRRKTLLVAVALVAILASALLYFLLQPKTPSQQVTQPAVNATKPQQAQNATQPQPPAQNATQSQLPQPKPPLIIAAIETSGGGRILANGTDTATWNSTRPFVLVLEAVPDKCMALDHWLVNGTRLAGGRLSLTIAGNTTVRAVFARAIYAVAITSNSSDAVAVVSVNKTSYTLPCVLFVNACSTIVVEPWETQELRPLNGTLSIIVEGDTTLRLFFQLKAQPLHGIKIYVNGTLQEAKAWRDPFFESSGTIETTSDGWIHLSGNPLVLMIYVPWDYKHVVVKVRDVSPPPSEPDVTLPIDILRYCEWGADPFAFGRSVRAGANATVVFNGCYTEPWNLAVRGRRFSEELPGAIEIDLHGEAWVRIEAYP